MFDLLPVFTDPNFLAFNPESFTKAIRDFVGPFILLAMGIGAIGFIFTKQMSGLVQFAVVAVVVAVIFFSPTIIKAASDAIAGMSGAK